MVDEIGIMRYSDHDLKLAPETRKLIDDQIKRLLNESYARAKKCLLKHAKDHHKLAKALIDYESLTGDEIRDYLKGKPLVQLTRRETEKELADLKEQLKKEKEKLLRQQQAAALAAKNKGGEEDGEGGDNGSNDGGGDTKNDKTKDGLPISGDVSRNENIKKEHTSRVKRECRSGVHIILKDIIFIILLLTFSFHLYASYIYIFTSFS